LCEGARDMTNTNVRPTNQSAPITQAGGEGISWEAMYLQWYSCSREVPDNTSRSAEELLHFYWLLPFRRPQLFLKEGVVHRFMQAKTFVAVKRNDLKPLKQPKE
jgi:hypothetical protein